MVSKVNAKNKMEQTEKQMRQFFKMQIKITNWLKKLDVNS